MEAWNDLTVVHHNFVYSYITGSGRISDEGLSRIALSFMADYLRNRQASGQAEQDRWEGFSKEGLMLRRPGTLVFIAAALLHCAALSIGAEEITPPGCRLAADDPLRAEVDRMMKHGAEFEQQQRLALEEKVNLLARARGWNKSNK